MQFESTADHFENTGSDCGFLTSDSAIINGTTEVTYKIPTVSTIHAKPTTPNISAIPLMTTVPNVLPSIYSKPLEETAKWDNGTTLIIGDSLLYGIEESKLKNTKVRMYPGAGVEDMSYNIYPLLRKNPTNIIIHAGTNNAISDNSSYIFRKLVELKNFVLSLLPHCTVIFSGLIDRYDVGKAQLTVQRTNDLLASSDLKIINNSNIKRSHLGKKGLHMNPHGTGKLAVNFLKVLKSL